VRAIPGVEDVREESAADGVVALVARSPRGDDLRRDLAAIVVRQGWDLLEVRPLPMSLEDLFVRLVREDRADRKDRA
jgi:hypothetical protein